MTGKRGRMRGFIVSDHADRDPDFRAEVGGLIAEGRLKLAETVVEGGIEAAPAAFVDMLRGRYLGKVVVRL
jgi:NADPH-dependent curcumin reductase CurA